MHLRAKSLGKYMLGLAMACAAFLPLPLTSQALENIDQISVGTHIFGAPLDKKALMGKVVVMELWGMG